MKSANRLVIIAAALVIFASASQVRAGGTSPSYNDGIAGSPKVRSTLDERYSRTGPAPAQPTVLIVTTTPNSKLAASPKVQSQKQAGITEVAPMVQSTTETAGYRPTGSDGITASPKARAMLGEHQQTVEIAPLK